MRKFTLKKLKDTYKISITPIPKVRIKVKFRKDSSWHADFGYRSHDYFVKNNLIWDEQGKFKLKGEKHSYFGCQDYSINDMWRYIRQQAYFNNIHDLDLV